MQSSPCLAADFLYDMYISNKCQAVQPTFLADRTNGRAYATMLCPSVVVCLSVTLCIVAKRCVLAQKLLWRAYRKSYMGYRMFT